MSIFQAVILGIVQGVTEFFPISSSGHLVIFQSLFGLKEPELAFDIFLHFGTLVSILIFFYKDILNLFGKDKELLFFILIASAPTFLIGFLLKDRVEEFFGAPQIVGYMLVLTGIWLILAALYEVKNKIKKRAGILNSIIIGIAQGIAIMPGISRSGTTIATGILAGLDKEFCFKFSFLLAIPAILGATLLKINRIGPGLVAKSGFSFLAGGLVAMIVGLFAIRVLLRLIKDNRLYIFGIYCILAGLSIIILFWR